jgi:hypothetical protein
LAENTKRSDVRTSINSQLKYTATSDPFFSSTTSGTTPPTFAHWASIQVWSKAGGDKTAPEGSSKV